MGQKVDISEVIELSEDLNTATADIKLNLTSISENIDKLNALSSFSGMTAKEAKNYFSDLHQTVLKTFDHLFTDLDEYLKKHLNSFESRVDKSESAIIESDYLMDTKEDINDDYDLLDGEKESIRETLANVSDISSASHPNYYSSERDKEDSVKIITDLDEDVESFTSAGYGEISEVEDLLHHIEKAIKNAGAVSGDGRFTDYKGTSTTVGLAALKDYNAEKREAVIAEAKDAKDKAIKDMDEPLQEILTQVYTEFKNGEIDEDVYYDHLDQLKKLQKEEEGEVSENFIKYVLDNFGGVTNTFEGNAIAGVIQQSMEDAGKKKIDNAELVKQMNANNPSSTSKYLNDVGNKLKNAGKAISGSLAVFTIGLDTYIDYKNTDKTVGEAFTKNATAGGAGFIASAATAKIIMGSALASNPVGWALAGGVVVGTGVTWTFNWAYDNNFLGIQDGWDWAGQKLDWAGEQVSNGLNWTGEQVNNGLNWAKDTISDGFNSIGEAFSSGLDAINPFS